MKQTGRILSLDGRPIIECTTIRLNNDGTGSFQVPLTVHVCNVGLACVVEIETERRIVVAPGKMKMMTYGHWEMLFSHRA
jgi:hypothetical protein